jgi:hypothetical protein
MTFLFYPDGVWNIIFNQVRIGPGFSPWLQGWSTA